MQNAFVKIAPIFSATRSNREKRRVENQEDIKHLLEEVSDYETDETFYKIFSRQASEGIPTILNTTREELVNLKWEEENGNISKLEPFEAGIIQSLNKHVTCLKTKWYFPSEASDLRCNTITLKDWEIFVKIQIAQEC